MNEKVYLAKSWYVEGENEDGDPSEHLFVSEVCIKESDIEKVKNTINNQIIEARKWLKENYKSIHELEDTEKYEFETYQIYHGYLNYTYTGFNMYIKNPIYPELWRGFVINIMDGYPDSIESMINNSINKEIDEIKFQELKVFEIK